jgi:hypothetical protein
MDRIRTTVVPESQMVNPMAFGPNKERERFYLLPGMGGNAARRKHKKVLQWSIVAGILVSAAMAMAMYLFNRISR